MPWNQLVLESNLKKLMPPINVKLTAVLRCNQARGYILNLTFYITSQGKSMSVNAENHLKSEPIMKQFFNRKVVFF